MATFPPRAENLGHVVDRILPQVDQLNIVFNEYDSIPDKYKNRSGLCPIIPEEDTKDVGKFFPRVSKEDLVFLVDDDIDYPADYVQVMMDAFGSLPDGGFVAGLYASIYRRPSLGRTLSGVRRFVAFHLFPEKIVRYRTVFSFQKDIKTPFFVDQLGTGTVILRGADMPPYEYMRNSRKFVDVRLARWCYENQLRMVALPRDAGWLSWEDDEHSIFKTFTTTHPRHVSKEIRIYAFNRNFVGREIGHHDSKVNVSTSRKD